MPTTHTQAVKIPAKFLPDELRSELKGRGCYGASKREAYVTFVTDDKFRHEVQRTDWDEGGICRYYYYEVRGGNNGFAQANPVNGTGMYVTPGLAIVICSVYAGLECRPSVFVRSQDAAEFFGLVPPVNRYEFRDMPAEIAADRLCDLAETQSDQKETKIYRDGAALLRRIAGVG